MSVSFSGELAYELHIANEHLVDVYSTLRSAGEAFGLTGFGLYAVESMRLEKGYRHWKADLITESLFQPAAESHRLIPTHPGNGKGIFTSTHARL